VARAQGHYLVFLNNDTVVTPGWLDGLVGWAMHDWPQVGLVGATSNDCPEPQLVTAGYEQLAGLDAFAQQRRQAYAGQALRVERLTGFCLLVRHEVLERVGGFDEGFGLGFFDDDDLCLRAREAGFQLLVALNVYIHHFGNRTFAGLGIDVHLQLEDNFQRFHDKWGPERCAGYRLPEATEPAKTANGSVGLADAAPAVVRSRPRKALCMIVRNEEANLAACLTSAADLFDKIRIVDTGSTDRTREIAASFGALVIDFPGVTALPPPAMRASSMRPRSGSSGWTRTIVWMPQIRISFVPFSIAWVTKTRVTP
jgi:GT2 family glycosyltransferase